MTFECLSQATSPTQIVMLWVTQLYNLGQNEELGESEVARSCPTLCTPWTVDCQAPLPMGFSRQEYWSGLTIPSPEDLPDPGIEPRFPTLEADVLPSEPPGKSKKQETVGQGQRPHPTPSFLTLPDGQGERQARDAADRPRRVDIFTGNAHPSSSTA